MRFALGAAPSASGRLRAVFVENEDEIDPIGNPFGGTHSKCQSVSVQDALDLVVSDTVANVTDHNQVALSLRTTHKLVSLSLFATVHKSNSCQMSLDVAYFDCLLAVTVNTIRGTSVTILFCFSLFAAISADLLAVK